MPDGNQHLLRDPYRHADIHLRRPDLAQDLRLQFQGVKRSPDGLHGRSRLGRLHVAEDLPGLVGEVAHLVEQRVRLGNLSGLVRLDELPGQVFFVALESVS